MRIYQTQRGISTHRLFGDGRQFTSSVDPPNSAVFLAVEPGRDLTHELIAGIRQDAREADLTRKVHEFTSEEMRVVNWDTAGYFAAVGKPPGIIQAGRHRSERLGYGSINVLIVVPCGLIEGFWEERGQNGI